MSSPETVAEIAISQLEISRVLPPVALDGALAQSIFQQGPFSTVIYDAQGHPLAVNAAFERLWGVSLDSVPPGYSVLADAELEREGVLPLVRRAFELGETTITPPVRYDISRVSTDGEGRVIWSQGHFCPVRDADGRVTHVVLTHLDLTEQREAEAALRQQEERLRLAQRAAHIGTFDWDVPSGRVAWTEEEERLFGIRSGTFDGTIEGWGRFVLPDDRARMEREMARAMARGDAEMDFDFRIRRPDGQVRWIEGRAQFLYAKDGAPLRMVGVNTDATDRRQAEEARSRSETLLREMERIAHIGSWEWDLATGVLTWSDELYRVYGMEPGTTMDFHRFLARVHPDDREMVQESVERALRDRQPFAFDHRVRWPDGTLRSLHGRGRVVLGTDGRPVRMVGSGQDITERKAVEEALVRARDEAEAANRAKSDFLAVMSHELRTPLNAIGGYAELLELGVRGPVNPAQRGDLQRIQQSQRHLLALINEVLSYARMEAGAVAYDVREVAVCECVAAAEAMVQPQASARGLSLERAECPAELLVRADAERMQQILLNLLSNAIKFTPAGGRIGMRVEPRADAVAVHVWDTGVGIAPEKLGMVFEPFVQVGRGLNNPMEGVGLGLAISRDLARGMGGDLAAESQPGAGSTFTLLLPHG